MPQSTFDGVSNTHGTNQCHLEGKQAVFMSAVGCRGILPLPSNSGLLKLLLAFLAEVHRYHAATQIAAAARETNAGGGLSPQNIVREVATQLVVLWGLFQGTDEQKYEFFRERLAAQLLWDRRYAHISRDILRNPTEIMELFRNETASRLAAVPN